MRTLLKRLALVALLPLSVGAIACAETADDDADMDVEVDDTADDMSPVDEPMTEPEMDMGGGTTELVVTNPMPHAMIVSVDQAGQVTELGSVPANGEATFSVAVPAPGTMTVVAHDEANTHSPSSTVTVDEGSTSVSWTIE
ncbi:hypothetical protein BH18GEM1_BH18GEM1_05310 [soil metagenome]